MGYVGFGVIALVLCCAVAGALAALRDDKRGLGKEFMDGLHAIGSIFVPVAGIMASVPLLSRFIESVVGPAFSSIGADPALAATTVIAVDMGGYQLAQKLAGSPEDWMMAMATGAMAGATVVFSIPVGLSLLRKEDHKYMALGVLSGVLSIPVGVLVSCLVMMIAHPTIRFTTPDGAAATATINLSLGKVVLNLVPLVLFVLLLAAGLRFFPDWMIRGFLAFGRFVDWGVKLVLVAVIVEYFTAESLDAFFGLTGGGVFSQLFGWWGFDPIFADKQDQVRAVEVAGKIGCMLAGAFPMVYLLKKYLAGPIEVAGRSIGLEASGAAGLLAAAANILAMFHLVKDMRPRDKVLVIAFAVCAAFTFGDHLAFTATMQPTMLAAILLGKLSGGAFAFWLARKLSVPQAEKLEMEDTVRSLFPLIPSLASHVVVVTSLGGGLTNRNFRLDAEGHSYVLRIAGEGTELLGIDRQREFACSEAAAAADVGPAVIAYLQEQRVLVTAFAPGRLLQKEDLNTLDVLRRVVGAIKRCHESPNAASVGAFDPFAIIRHYRACAMQRQVPLPARLDEAMALLGRIEQDTASDDVPCLCHNDLLAANFIDDGQLVRIIDWEYGGLGDRFFDLGNFAVNHDLNDDQERALLALYFGEVRDDHLRRLRLMRLVSDLREATWGFLQASISKLQTPAYYLEYGERHLQRFHTKA